jgi:hypothetical protein
MIRVALENKLATISPAIDTIHENDPTTSYTPVSGTPYQTVQMIYGQSEDMCITNDMIKDSGIFQVTLYYPTGKGTKDSEDRAMLIRSTFANATKLINENDIVTISKTADIKTMGVIADRYVVVVSIYYTSYS